jgi:hypothetical protein
LAVLLFGDQFEDRDDPVGALLVLAETRRPLDDDPIDGIAFTARRLHSIIDHHPILAWESGHRATRDWSSPDAGITW